MSILFIFFLLSGPALFAQDPPEKQSSVKTNEHDISTPESLDRSPGIKDGDTSASEKEESRATAEKERGSDITPVVPVRKEQISMPLLLGLDLLVPGGGHFYRGSYVWGGTFLTLKVAGAWSIYYFYKDWQYIRSLYVSAKKANEELDPDHELLFKDPRGGYKTVREFKREYDSAAQNITFTVMANAVVYGVSLAINYFAAREYNAERAPLFSLYYSMPLTSQDWGVMGVQYTYRY